ncbi:MAG TPA: GNAT family N-acetyltransferase, partial [Burkholderiales bacterium]|nr:GNAT family N-acetyltransferase [Burkholderiales bacterium]
MAEPNYDVFLAGDLVDLVVPNARAIHTDGWYAWLNDQALTRNMEQGMYPKTAQTQEAYLAELLATPSRLALMIKPKEEDAVVGICSLSKISHITRQADFAMVVARRTGSFKSSFFGMEAKCLMTEHAFETLGLERINSYQSTALKDWQRWQILFGYKMEG